MAVSAHKQFPVTNLVMYFDPANRKSYSSGTAITDLSSARNNGVLTNGPTFTNILGGYITLDGSNDYIEITRTGDFNVSTSNACCCLWFRANVINAGNAIKENKKTFITVKNAIFVFNENELKIPVFNKDLK